MPRKRNSSDKSRRVTKALDLSVVNPKGRLDVLAAKSIEQLAQSRAPQLVPFLQEHKGVIHAALNENLGPHAIGLDVPKLIETLAPYAPLLCAAGNLIIGKAIENMRANAANAVKQKGEAA